MLHINNNAITKLNHWLNFFIICCTLFLSYIAPFLNASGEDHSLLVQLNKCRNFVDNRTGNGGNLNVNLNFNRDSETLEIPAQLSSRPKIGDPPLRFRLKNPDNWTCRNVAAILLGVEWEDVSSEDDETLSHSPIHFSSDGYLLGEDEYYHSPYDGFCVKTIADYKIELVICSPKCGSGGTICIPKCCPMDEGIQIGNGSTECVKVSTTTNTEEPFDWLPEIFSGNARISKQSKKIQFYHKYHNVNDAYCSMKKMKSELKLARFTRSQSPLSAKDKREVDVLYFFRSKRAWSVDLATEIICIDSLVNEDFSNNANIKRLSKDYYMGLFCKLNLESSIKPNNSSFKRWTYIAITLLPVPFLIATIGMYLSLFDKLNLNGLTILTYSSCYLVHSIAYLASVLAIFLDNDSTIIRNWVKTGSREWFCYCIAISNHFFYLSTYSWLTMLNFDLWTTFKSMRMVDQKRSKDWRRFILYSVVGWGVPFLLLMCFIIIDEVYIEPKTGVPVPGYATVNCGVNTNFEGYFVYAPTTIIFAFNFFLMLHTIKIFCGVRRRQATLTLSGRGQQNSSSSSSANKYSAKLFGKLFMVMGGGYSFEILEWYFANGTLKWTMTILHFLNEVVPIILFCIFCLNERTLGQLQGNYPRFAARLRFIKEAVMSPRKCIGVGRNRQPPTVEETTAQVTLSSLVIEESPAT